MNTNNRLYFYIALTFIVSAFFISACASESSPKGGPKDETPPFFQAYQSTPSPSELTNFREKTIILKFDERIQLKNIRKELIITPTPDEFPNVYASNNKLIIKFKKPLQDNTTYSFNFGNGIADITEGNITKDIYFAFSTGDIIDSLEINGSVKNYLSQKPIQDFTVALFHDTVQNIITSKPYYYSYTNSQGIFSIKHIHENKYKLIAYNDKNKNHKIDLPSEEIAFIDSTLNIYQKTDSLQLLSFTTADSTFKILSIKQKLDNVEITTNNDIEKIKTKFPYTIIEKTVLINPKYIDTLQTSFTIVDLYNHSLDTTINLKIDSTNFFNKKFSLTNKMLISDSNQIKLQFNKYIQTDLGSIHYKNQLDSIYTKTKLIEYDSSSYSYLYSIPNNIKYPINVIKDSLIVISAYNDTLITRPFMLALPDEGSTGTISGSIKTQYNNYKIELLIKDKVEYTLNSRKEFSFKNIKPGNYTLRISVDENNDNRYETGNYFLKIQPERIYLYPKEINLKANWEIGDINIEL